MSHEAILNIPVIDGKKNLLSVTQNICFITTLQKDGKAFIFLFFGAITRLAHTIHYLTTLDSEPNHRKAL